MILEFMDGSGGRKAANYMYANARPDGLTLGSLSGGVIAQSILGETGVMYEADKFIYLGSPESVTHQIIYTRRELGLDSLEELRAASGIRIGAQSVGHVAYVAARFFAYFLGHEGSKVYRSAIPLPKSMRRCCAANWTRDPIIRRRSCGATRNGWREV